MALAQTIPVNDLRLLALDGGGVRGLSALMILQQLMEIINPENPPKPCDYFDMIGGTSTGGLIAIMLGRLRMSIDDCINAYLSLSDRIFQKKRHPITVKGSIQGSFDSEELAQAVKEVVKAQDLPEDTLLKDVSNNGCKVFVCATSKETTETVCLTSYPSPRSRSDLLNSIKIWEACRATSAASSFFDPIAIGRYKEEFVDGATGANNPVWEVWNQAQLIWGPQPIEGQIRCLVSIGTGTPSLESFQDDVFHIGKTLIAIATETEQTAEKFRRDKTHLDDSGRYYRFNVDRGLEKVGLEDSKKRKEIAAATSRYVGLEGVFKQMRACAINMAGREYLEKYQTGSYPKHVLEVSNHVERPVEMAELERVRLSERQRPNQTKLFYQLDRQLKYLLPDGTYWQHLTLNSYETYEKIYARCPKEENMVLFADFLNEFNLQNSTTPQSTLEEFWNRTLSDRSGQPKGLVMAILYMLHVEIWLKCGPPKDINREALKRFDYWIPCQCKRCCGLEWNFVNLIGLHRGGDEAKCDVVKYLASGSAYQFWSRKYKVLKAMKEKWGIGRNIVPSSTF